MSQTLGSLLDELQKLKAQFEELGLDPENVTVMWAAQPGYPMEYSVGDALLSNLEELKAENRDEQDWSLEHGSGLIYLTEGDQTGYLENWASKEWVG